jgi:TonB-dependent receptor
LLGCALVVLGASIPLRAQESAKRDFDLPAGNADRTLKLFSEQAGRGLLVGTETAKDIRTNAVKGRLSASDALALMLKDTGLEASQDAENGAFVVRKREGHRAAAKIDLPAPVPPPKSVEEPPRVGTIAGRVRDANTNSYLASASVRIVDLDRRTTTLSGGEFFFGSVPVGEHTLLISYIGYDDVREAVVVKAAAEASVQVDLGTEVVRLGKLVVVGEREGQARALQQKRMADSIIDVVSADSAGKLPDGNAAEAVRRLPGVFAEIDQNEGRFIVVRGIDANLNNITINGLDVGSPGAGDRGAQMDAVPADLISRIEVIKAVTPDMDAQGIGASINIVTPSAFDRAEPFAYGTLGGGIFNGPSSDRGGDTPYNGSATFGTQFGGGKWGLVVGGSYSYRHYISNRRSGGGTWYPSAASGPGADIFFPDTQSLYYYDVQRWRQGANLDLEYRPDGDNRYFLRLVNNFFKDDEGRDLDSFEFYRTTYPDSFTPTSAHFVGGRSSIEYRHYVQKHRINNYAVGGRNKLGSDTRLDYTFSAADTGIRVPERLDVQFRSAANLASDIDTSTPMWRVTPEAKYDDLANYPLRRVLIRTDNEYERIYHAAANLRHDRVLVGRDSFWQVGVKYLWHEKGWDRVNKDYTPSSPAWTLDQFDLTAEPREIFGGYYPMTRRIDFSKFMDFFSENPDRFVYGDAVSVADSYTNYFRIREGTAAGYAMARVNFGELSVLAGVRVEDTRVKVTGIEFPSENGIGLEPREYHGDGRYTDLLPGVHFRFAARKNWILRAAWTNTIGRPSYSDIGVTRSFSYTPDDTSGGAAVYTGSITDGNPDLKPYASMNFDVASEYYFQNTGIFSVGAFSKDIRHPIYEYSFVAHNVVFDGLNFSSLAYEKPLNADSGRITGVELNYQQQFTMLPSPLDGLGFGANFTYTDSVETLPTRPGEKLPFPKQAGKIYNLALFYERYRFQARLAYTYTGAYVMSYGADVNGDDYKASRKIVDAKVSFRLSHRITLFGDVINFGQEPLEEYAGFPSRNSATERYWWTANFGVHWRY